jgi:hypothetical protein
MSDPPAGQPARICISELYGINNTSIPSVDFPAEDLIEPTLQALSITKNIFSLSS